MAGRRTSWQLSLITQASSDVTAASLPRDATRPSASRASKRFLIGCCLTSRRVPHSVSTTRG